jgi:hypothetical protein
MVHLLVHVVDDVIHLRPPFLHNMMSFERLNDVLKGYVRNRARPDGSIAKRARGLQVEETRVEEEPDEVLDHGPDLAHRRRRYDLFVHIVV